MERLRDEEAETSLAEPDDVKVSFPKKKYEPLPTGQGAAAEEPKSWFHDKKKVAFVLLLVAIILIAVVVSIVILVANKHDHEGYKDLKDRFACILIGEKITKGGCEKAGCEFYSNSLNGGAEPACVYGERNQYYVANKTEHGGYVDVLLKIRDDLNLTLSESIYELEPQLFARVILTRLGALQIQIQIDEIDSTPKIRTTFDEQDFQLFIPKIGQDFYLQVERRDSKQTILSTKDMPLVVTGELVQFVAKMPGRRFYSNGRELKAEKESFLIWNRKDNVNLPAFYGVNKESDIMGLASLSPFPTSMEFTTTTLFQEQRVSFTQLGGSVFLVLMTGPTFTDYSTQLTEQIGRPFVAPFWSLGSIMINNENTALKSSQYPIDVIIVEGGSKLNISSSQTFQEVVHSMSPLVQGNTGVASIPMVVTAQGEHVEGKINIKPGNLSHYLDFTQLNFDSYLKKVILKDAQSLNFEDSYPFNAGPQICAKNLINESPFLKAEPPLAEGTLCPDYLHGFETSREYQHRDVHNYLSSRQARLTHSYMGGQESIRVLQLSDSIALGGGAYTAMKIPIKNQDDLSNLIKKIEWYGMMGIHAVPVFAGDFGDKELVMMYHKLATLLPFTSGDERALEGGLTQDDLNELQSYIMMKYSMYPCWLSGVHTAGTHGTPVVRSMSYNFPTVEKFIDPATDMQQFMVDDNVIVYYGGVMGHSTRTVHLPANTTWWQYSQNNGRWEFIQATAATPGEKTLKFSYTPAPRRLYLVKGGSVQVVGQQMSDDDMKQGNLIDKIREGDIQIRVILCDFAPKFNDTFYLVGYKDDTTGVRAEMTVDVTVDSREDGLSIQLKPFFSGSSKGITFDAITILGSKRFAKKITVNGDRLDGDYINSENYIGIISMKGVDKPPLDKTYNIEVTYSADESD